MYFRYRIIPYSNRQKNTKMIHKISHNPIEEILLAFVVGEFVFTGIKMLIKTKVTVTRTPILPGFSGRIVKLN